MLEKWLLILLMGAAFGGASFVAGMLYSEKDAALDQVKVVVREKEVIKYVAKKDNEQAAKHEQERAALTAEMTELRREYANLRKKLDARDGVCDLPDDVLGLLNRARAAGRLTPASSKPDAGVRPAATSAGRTAGSAGGAND